MPKWSDYGTADNQKGTPGDFSPAFIDWFKRAEELRTQMLRDQRSRDHWVTVRKSKIQALRDEITRLRAEIKRLTQPTKEVM